MNARDIVAILQVGLGGVAFLLALLSYHLIAREQAKPQPTQDVLRTARWFFYQCILLTLIVGSFQVFDRFYFHADRHVIALCMDSLDLLSERRHRVSNLVELATAVGEHVATCTALRTASDRGK